MLRKTIIMALTLPLWAQKYTGPRPEKSDVPYLVHADSLVETEVKEAREQTKKDDITYVVAGANSPARTPLASPILLVQADKLSVDRLTLYKLESKNGQREITFRKKKQNVRPIRLNVTPLGENLFRIEVEESLSAGEYSLTPEGSNQVFCFAIF